MCVGTRQVLGVEGERLNGTASECASSTQDFVLFSSDFFHTKNTQYLSSFFRTLTEVRPQQPARQRPACSSMRMAAPM